MDSLTISQIGIHLEHQPDDAYVQTVVGKERVFWVVHIDRQLAIYTNHREQAEALVAALNMTRLAVQEAAE